MPFLNQKGEVMDQTSIWLPKALHELVKADHLNLSAFVREQLEEMYSDRATVEALNNRFKLMQRAKESHTRQRQLVDEQQENRERCLQQVRQTRDARRADEDRDQEHRENLRDAWEVLVEQEEINLGRLPRQLPENDLNGDYIEFWPRLARSLSSVNGDTFNEYEVIAYAKSVVATS